MPGLAAYKGHLGKSAQKLFGWFRDYQAAVIPGMQVVVYSSMLSDQDTSNQDALALRDQARGMFARFSAAISFVEPELLAIPQEKIEQFMREEPELATFKHYFDILRTREGHVRSPEVEALLATVSDPLDLFRAAHAVLADGEIDYGKVQTDGGDVEVAAGTLESLLHDTDINVRKAAWEQYADGYLDYKNTFATLITGGMKKDVFMARAHNYPSAVEAALQTNNIPRAVYDNMLDTATPQAADLASLLGRQAPHPGPRQAARLRCVRAARQGRAEGNLRGSGGPNLQGHGPAGRRIRRAYAQGPARTALGGRLSQPGQAQRGLLQRHVRHQPLHPDELQQQADLAQHARPRAGPLHALVPDAARTSRRSTPAMACSWPR